MISKLLAFFLVAQVVPCNMAMATDDGKLLPADTLPIEVPESSQSISTNTKNILRAAKAAKRLGRNILFQKGTYSFQLESDPFQNAGTNNYPDHKAQTWIFDSKTEVPSSVFITCAQMMSGSESCNEYGSSNEVIGVQHNFLQKKIVDWVDKNPNSNSYRRLKPVRLGDFLRPPPPRSSKNMWEKQSGLEIIPHWWSRFGSSDYEYEPNKPNNIISYACTQYYRCETPWKKKCIGGGGQLPVPLSMYGPSDYTWEWNHPTAPRGSLNNAPCKGEIITPFRTEKYNDTWSIDVDYPAQPYDPNRHPLLGWYRDDDPIIQDWILFWLREAGIHTVTVDQSAWNDSLLDGSVPNASAFTFIPWMTSSDLARWETRFDKFFETGRLHIEYISNKPYAVFYVFSIEGLKPGMHNSRKQQAVLNKLDAPAFLDAIANYIINKSKHKLHGVIILSRSEMKDAILDKNKVIVRRAFYANFDATKQLNTYIDQVRSGSYKDKYIPADGIFSVPTSLLSYRPHYSKYTWGGSTPEYFGCWLDAIVRKTIDSDWSGLPLQRPIVMVYNVSEWLEAGASLQPSMGSDFGYLNSVKAIINNYKGISGVRHVLNTSCLFCCD